MDWKATISSVAPWIGTALGGPLGGMAVTAVAEALGLSEKTEDAIKSAIGGVTVEQMVELKNADQMFTAQMQELGFKNQQAVAALAVENTKDARAMQVATRSIVPAVLAIMMTIGFMVVLIGQMGGWLVPDDGQPVMLQLGALNTAWAASIAYYFGTTFGSGSKTELIARAPAITN